mgnify:CR=1 FL=1
MFLLMCGTSPYLCFETKASIDLRAAQCAKALRAKLILSGSHNSSRAVLCFNAVNKGGSASAVI